MTQKGLSVLKALIENNYTSLINQVIVGRDTNVANDFAINIFELCHKHNITSFERNDNYQLNADYTFAISWRWLLSTKHTKLIILHDSLLPKYRGFAPLVAAMLNKDEKVGVSALFAKNYYDEGDIIQQQSININYPIKIAEVIQKISLLYVELTLSIFKRIKSNSTINAVTQNNALATYSVWRNEDDYRINWNQAAEEILNFIYTVSQPYKGAFSYLEENKKIRILDAQIVDDVSIEHRHVGKVIFLKDKLPVIICKTGLLMLTNVCYDEGGNNALPFDKFRIRLS